MGATMTRMTAERLSQLEQHHKGWLINPNASRGQVEDSKAVLNLLEELAAVTRERDDARAALKGMGSESLQRLMVALTKERDQARAERGDARAALAEYVSQDECAVNGRPALVQERDRLAAEVERLKGESDNWQAAHATSEAVLRGDGSRDDEMDALRAENETLKGTINRVNQKAAEQLDAVRDELDKCKATLEEWAELNCACESGGGPTDSDPEFICGYHAELIALAPREGA